METAHTGVVVHRPRKLMQIADSEAILGTEGMISKTKG